MQGSEADSDLFNLDEDDQDMTITQTVDEININKMNFNDI
ncbi:unnamed protein product, partial [Rotaria sordida]